MDKRSVPLGFGGVNVPLGSHLALFYRNREEQRGIILPFINTGLERGARCIYIVDEETENGKAEVLQELDVDAGAALSSGQLSILTTEETYLSESYFSLEKMLDFLEAELRTAIEAGYGEVRITGEMTWALQQRPGVERLAEYEAMVNKLFERYPQVAICQYNLTKFDGNMIMDVLKTHPACILGGLLIKNHFYVPPDKFLREFGGAD